jgi:hypothetical protein
VRARGATGDADFIEGDGLVGVFEGEGEFPVLPDGWGQGDDAAFASAVREKRWMMRHDRGRLAG